MKFFYHLCFWLSPSERIRLRKFINILYSNVVLVFFTSKESATDLHLFLWGYMIPYLTQYVHSLVFETMDWHSSSQLQKSLSQKCSQCDKFEKKLHSTCSKGNFPSSIFFVNWPLFSLTLLLLFLYIWWRSKDSGHASLPTVAIRPVKVQ